MHKVGRVVRARDLGAAAGAEVGKVLQVVRDAELLLFLRRGAPAQLHGRAYVTDSAQHTMLCNAMQLRRTARADPTSSQLLTGLRKR